jgi:hypothetical protein
MFKVGILIWIVLGTTLAGLAILAVVLVPALYAQGMKAIPIAALAGFAIAIPFSLMIAKQITDAMRK